MIRALTLVESVKLVKQILNSHYTYLDKGIDDEAGVSEVDILVNETVNQQKTILFIGKIRCALRK